MLDLHPLHPNARMPAGKPLPDRLDESRDRDRRRPVHEGKDVAALLRLGRDRAHRRQNERLTTLFEVRILADDLAKRRLARHRPADTHRPMGKRDRVAGNGGGHAGTMAEGEEIRLVNSSGEPTSHRIWLQPA